MSKEDYIEFMGKIVENMPNALFKVELENGSIVLCHLSGRIKQNKIRMALGDKVTVQMTPYDLQKGRIHYRHKN